MSPNMRRMRVSFLSSSDVDMFVCGFLTDVCIKPFYWENEEGWAKSDRDCRCDTWAAHAFAGLSFIPLSFYDAANCWRPEPPSPETLGMDSLFLRRPIASALQPDLGRSPGERLRPVD